MCSVSVIHDYFGQQPVQQWTPNTWNDYQEIIRRLGELDKKLGQLDCVDPAKAAWMKQVEDRLANLEKAAK